MGSDQNNLQVRQVAELVAEQIPGCTLEFGPPGADARDDTVPTSPRSTANFPGSRVTGTLRRVSPNSWTCSVEFGWTRASRPAEPMFASPRSGTSATPARWTRCCAGHGDDRVVRGRNMNITPTPIPGPAFVDVVELTDERGFFARSFCRRVR